MRFLGFAFWMIGQVPSNTPPSIVRESVWLMRAYLSGAVLETFELPLEAMVAELPVVVMTFAISDDIVASLRLILPELIIRSFAEMALRSTPAILKLPLFWMVREYSSELMWLSDWLLVRFRVPLIVQSSPN